MTAADWIISWTTASAVVGVAAVASYEHAYALARANGEVGWTGRLVPLTVGGLIYASSIVMLDSARRGTGDEELIRVDGARGGIEDTTSTRPEPATTSEDRQINRNAAVALA